METLYLGDICTHKTIQFVCGFFYMCKSNLQMPQKIRLRRMTGPYFLRHLETGQKFFAPLSMPRGSAPIIPCGSAFRICRWQIHGSRRRARARVRGGFLCKSSDDGALFFAAFGDGAKKIFFAPLPCLGALPLSYPAAPPSVFAVGKYTATTPSPTSTSAMTTRTWTEPTGILSTS